MSLACFHTACASRQLPNFATLIALTCAASMLVRPVFSGFLSRGSASPLCCLAQRAHTHTHILLALLPGAQMVCFPLVGRARLSLLGVPAEPREAQTPQHHGLGLLGLCVCQQPMEAGRSPSVPTSLAVARHQQWLQLRCPCPDSRSPPRPKTVSQGTDPSLTSFLSSHLS